MAAAGLLGHWTKELRLTVFLPKGFFFGVAFFLFGVAFFFGAGDFFGLFDFIRSSARVQVRGPAGQQTRQSDQTRRTHPAACPCSSSWMGSDG